MSKVMTSTLKLCRYTLWPHARTKHTSSYSKRKFKQRLAKSLLNSKYMTPPKALQKNDIEIKSSPSQSLAAERRRQRLMVLGNEYKHDIYGILQSGHYGSELASISFAKVSMDSRANQLDVHWRLTGEEKVDQSMQANLSCYVSDIQSKFTEIHPNANLPKIRFKAFEDNAITTETLLANLDLKDIEEDDDDSSSHRLPQMKFVQDVYRVNRSEILAKLHSAPSTVTQFGANEQETPQH